jgi:hypothetical protein
MLVKINHGQCCYQERRVRKLEEYLSRSRQKKNFKLSRKTIISHVKAARIAFIIVVKFSVHSKDVSKFLRKIVPLRRTVSQRQKETPSFAP